MAGLESRCFALAVVNTFELLVLFPQRSCEVAE